MNYHVHMHFESDKDCSYNAKVKFRNNCDSLYYLGGFSEYGFILKSSQIVHTDFHVFFNASETGETNNSSLLEDLCESKSWIWTTQQEWRKVLLKDGMRNRTSEAIHYFSYLFCCFWMYICSFLYMDLFESWGSTLVVLRYRKFI